MPLHFAGSDFALLQFLKNRRKVWGIDVFDKSDKASFVKEKIAGFLKAFKKIFILLHVTAFAFALQTKIKTGCSFAGKKEVQKSGLEVLSNDQ